MSEHDQTRSNQNNLEETGKQIGNLIADDMDMDPENEMEVDPAEEVTVSGENYHLRHTSPPETLAHNGRNDFYKRQFLALEVSSQSWKLNNLSN